MCTARGSADRESTTAAVVVVVSSGLFILKSVGVCFSVCAPLCLLHSIRENKDALALAGPDCSH